MKLRNLGKNVTSLQLANITILVSYDTPVAYYNCITDKYFRTSKKWSATTSNHINKWLDGVNAEEKEQEFFDDLLKVG